MTGQVLVNILISASQWALIGLGFALIYHTVKFFHMAHACLIALGPCIAQSLVFRHNCPLWIAICISLLGCGILGWLFHSLAYRPLSRRRASSSVLLLASLGLFSIIQSCILLFWGSEPVSLRSDSTIRTVNAGIGMITNVQVAIFTSAIVLSILVFIMLRFTRVGLKIRAVSENAGIAGSCGLHVERTYALVFVIGSVLAAAVGILIAFDTQVNSNTALNVFLMGLAVVIMARSMDVIGIGASSLIIGVSQHAVPLYIGLQWQDAVTFLILLGCLILRPLERGPYA